MEFKRHSRSIDPRRHSCGACKSKLVQVQPAPRRHGTVKGEGGNGDGDGGAERGMSEYQRFVKENFGRVRGKMKGLGVGDVMKRLGEEFRRMKAENVVGEGDQGWKERAREGSEDVVVIIDDDEGDETEDEKGLEEVARKLDFLSLG